MDSEDPQRIYRGYRYRLAVQGMIPTDPRLAVSNDGGETWQESVDPLEFFDGEVYGGDLPMLATGPGGVV